MNQQKLYFTKNISTNSRAVSMSAFSPSHSISSKELEQCFFFFWLGVIVSLRNIFQISCFSRLLLLLTRIMFQYQMLLYWHLFVNLGFQFPNLLITRFYVNWDTNWVLKIGLKSLTFYVIAKITTTTMILRLPPTLTMHRNNLQKYLNCPFSCLINESYCRIIRLLATHLLPHYKYERDYNVLMHLITINMLK